MCYINKFTTLVVHFGAVETNSQPKYANNGFEWYKTSNQLVVLTQYNIVVRTCVKVILLAKLHLFYTITILYLLFLGMQCFKYQYLYTICMNNHRFEKSNSVNIVNNNNHMIRYYFRRFSPTFDTLCNCIFKVVNFVFFVQIQCKPQKTCCTVDQSENCGEKVIMCQLNKFTTLVSHFGALEANSQVKYTKKQF